MSLLLQLREELAREDAGLALNIKPSDREEAFLLYIYWKGIQKFGVAEKKEVFRLIEESWDYRPSSHLLEYRRAKRVLQLYDKAMAEEKNPAEAG